MPNVPFDERRNFKRIQVCVPVEICLVDRYGKHIISEWSHAIVQDISVGGIKIRLLGSAANLFRETQASQQKIKIKFVPIALRAYELLADLRWSRPEGTNAWDIGVQFGKLDIKSAEHLVHRLRGYSENPGMKSSTLWLTIGLIIVSAILAIKCRFLNNDVSILESERDAARARVATLREAVEVTSNELDKVLAQSEKQGECSNTPEPQPANLSLINSMSNGNGNRPDIVSADQDQGATQNKTKE